MLANSAKESDPFFRKWESDPLIGPWPQKESDPFFFFEARRYYAQVADLLKDADAVRTELQQAKAFLARR